MKSEISNYSALKAFHRQSSPHSCISKKRRAWNVMFCMLRYKRLVLSLFLSKMLISDKIQRDWQAEENRLKTVHDSEELKMSWLRARANISLLQFKNMNMRKRHSERRAALIWSDVPYIQVASSRERTGTLTLFGNDIARETLQEFMAYKQERRDGSCIYGTVMSMVTLHAWIPTLVHCLIGRQERRGHLQKKIPRQVYNNGWDYNTAAIWEYLGNFEALIIGRGHSTRRGLSSEKRRDAVMGILRSVTNLYTLLSVKNRLYWVKGGGLRPMWLTY